MRIPYKLSLARWQKRRIRIFRLYKSGLSKSQIARRMGVSRQRIGKVLNGSVS